MKYVIIIFIFFLTSCSMGMRANKDRRQENETFKKAHYDSGVSFYSKSADQLLIVGGDKVAEKKYDEAVRIYQQITKMGDAEDNEKADALYRLAQIYKNFFYDKRDTNKSKLYLNEIITKYPKTGFAVSAKQMLETLN